MYFWNEKYENIWDSAPRPRYRGSGEDGTAGQCVCKDKSLREQLDKLMEAFSVITTSDVTSVAQRYMNEDICCCNKNYCKHTDVHISDSELDSDMWDLYTFFLNEFNTKDLAVCSAPNDSPGGGTEPKAPPEDGASDDAMLDLFGNDADKAQRFPQCDQVFKVKIMQTMRDCMTQRDIHRFHLLQHTKLILFFFNFRDELETDEVGMLPPPGD